MIILTPEIWSLWGVCGPREGRPDLAGFWLEAEYAVASDGFMLVAHPTAEGSDVTPETWRIRPVYPETIPHGATVSIPVELGLHAARVARPGMEGDGAPCLVEVFDSKMPIPAWRQVVPDERKAKGRVRIDPEKLYELTLALYGACGAADLVFWGSRSPCLMRSGKSVGIVMPLRREDT